MILIQKNLNLGPSDFTANMFSPLGCFMYLRWYFIAIEANVYQVVDSIFQININKKIYKACISDLLKMPVVYLFKNIHPASSYIKSRVQWFPNGYSCFPAKTYTALKKKTENFTLFEIYCFRNDRLSLLRICVLLMRLIYSSWILSCWE